MKKLISLALACIMILSIFPMLVSAEVKLPFELKAPNNVSAVWMEGGDSPTTVSFAYSLDNEITNLRMTDEEFNDNPVVAYTLTVPETLQKQVTKVFAAGGSIFIETQARVKGESEWIEVTGDREVKPGEMKAHLLYLAKEGETIPKDTIIELRSRYWCAQRELDDIYSDWSEVISFGTDDISLEPGSTSSGDADPDENAPAEKGKCSICHFCPQPLGLCIFIWLAILVVVIVVVVIVLKAKKKGNQ